MTELSDHIVAPLSAVADPDIRDDIARSINLMDNGTRAVAGRVLVARAIGGRMARAGDAHDVEAVDGTRLTVLVGGLVQTWAQDTHSFVVWDVARRPLMVPDGRGGFGPTEQVARWSDVYVFATHTGTRPGEVSEWRYRVVPTGRVDAGCGDQHSITSSWIDAHLDPVVCRWDGLAAALEQVSAPPTVGPR